MNNIGIDVITAHVPGLEQELQGHPDIVEVFRAGHYWQDPSYSQVHVITSLDEDSLLDWLYEHSRAEYIGVFEMRN